MKRTTRKRYILLAICGLLIGSLLGLLVSPILADYFYKAPSKISETASPSADRLLSRPTQPVAEDIKLMRNCYQHAYVIVNGGTAQGYHNISYDARCLASSRMAIKLFDSAQAKAITNP